VQFAPGGYHLMMFEPTDQPMPGDSVKLVLHCSQDQSQTVTATVRKSMPGQASSSGGHMNHDNMRHKMHNMHETH